MGRIGNGGRTVAVGCWVKEGHAGEGKGKGRKGRLLKEGERGMQGKG